MLYRRTSLFLLLIAFGGSLSAQRSYAPASVLASGTWYKLSLNRPGIYRIDLAWLNAAGISTSGLTSSSIRLFGNGGQMLPESNSSPRPDDLRELAIEMVDGGDGLFNGSDYLLFYANGPDYWLADTSGHQFSHQKNLYSDRSYFFLNIGGSSGKRIVNAPNAGAAAATVTRFNERSFHELDTVNFLTSGKEWFGEEMSDLPGRSLSQSFTISLPGWNGASPARLSIACIARSAGNPSTVDLRFNSGAIGQLTIPPVGTSAFDAFARKANAAFNFTPQSESFDLSYRFSPGSVNAQAWIDWFELFYDRNLSLAGLSQLNFRDWSTLGNPVAGFLISHAGPASRVWQVTDPLNPVNIPVNYSSGEIRFTASATRLQEYIAFTGDGYLSPRAEGTVSGQNLHAVAPADLIIITHPALESQASRLANFHRQKDSMRVLLVTTGQIFNEFSSGSPDPTALRDFLKMYHDKFSGDSLNRLKYVLLFGDASYDYRDRLSNNTNLVPAWETTSSLDPLSTYTSDDFFAMLDDGDDINSGLAPNLLDLGIGRVPARTSAEARAFADKLEAYHSPEALGPWRNEIVLIADDEDQNLHLQDAETIAATIAAAAPVFNIDKIYLDAYPQQTGPGGSSYPRVNEQIDNKAISGCLIWNFTGHGGSKRLAEEVVLDQPIADGWTNANRLPLMITATCDFAPYDVPGIASLGENILLRPQTGAIALMTTTRVVFAYSNRLMNTNYMQFALATGPDGKYHRLGDATREAKNYTYQNSTDVANNRKFTLLGDPAMRLGFPGKRVRITRINGIDAALPDTLQAGELVQVEGEITDAGGSRLPGFQGKLGSAIFDKPALISTLGNDPGSPPTSFSSQNTALFRGSATISDGKFSFKFKMPRDINYQFGNGKLSLYAQSGSQDAAGVYGGFVVGGSITGTDLDKEGPVIRAFLNDEKFVNGGLTNAHPVLFLKLADSSGINATGTGIGHDLIATLDHDDNRYFVLNRFYECEPDSYQKGGVRFQLPVLEPGPHTLTIKAWDAVNNSSLANLDFVVANDEELSLAHVLNYPNPFTTRTAFWFEHNKPGLDLQVRIQIFTINGRVIKSLQKTINTPGNRSNDLEWDGRDEFGDRVARGIYLYKLTVIAPGRKKMEKTGKLAVF